jgi:ABC-type phosphate/phosphonate transport system permease subunit
VTSTAATVVLAVLFAILVSVPFSFFGRFSASTRPGSRHHETILSVGEESSLLSGSLKRLTSLVRWLFSPWFPQIRK